MHAFFVIMGGYHAYDEDGPLYPLSPKAVVSLVRDSKFQIWSQNNFWAAVAPYIKDQSISQNITDSLIATSMVDR